ncbi:MAG: replication-associated recombination protein A [Anaerolineae bacterium]
MDLPLSEQLRPKSLAEIAGQEHLLGPDGWMTKVVQAGRPLSILLWGPPGCGKTTIARVYAQAFRARFIAFSPLFHGIQDLKKVIQDVKSHPLLQEKLILFVDEIHRFNKSQQDAFLPLLEDGTIVLIGATTENPSFALNNALLSRLRVLSLNYLDEKALEMILQRFETKVRKLPLTSDARAALIKISQGDGRHLLNMVENLEQISGVEVIDPEKLFALIQKRLPVYDKKEDGHYNLISALHKAVRGSDPDASLYWLARMLNAGEDPLFISRRIVRMASEDIGLADPAALQIALHAKEAYQQLGSPEGELALAQAIVYLALAPKSNAVYTAFQKAQELSEKTSHLSPPKSILNAPTDLMREIGYGAGYVYDHDAPNCFSGEHYFPSELKRTSFYHPKERGLEREMKKRADYFEKLRQKKPS